MKTLYIVRHAKSSWDDPAQHDFDRPLNKRGLRDAPDMGRRLSAAGIQPQYVVSSPANRAITTARIITDLLKIGSIHEMRPLYHASANELLAIIRQLPNEYDTVMLFGHNNGITELVNALSGEAIANVPTCGVAGISFELTRWADVERSSGRLVLFDFPKKGKS